MPDPIGEQGSVGLPGLRGPSGPAGDAGIPGTTAQQLGINTVHTSLLVEIWLDHVLNAHNCILFVGNTGLQGPPGMFTVA